MHQLFLGCNSICHPPCVSFLLWSFLHLLFDPTSSRKCFQAIFCLKGSPVSSSKTHYIWWCHHQLVSPQEAHDSARLPQLSHYQCLTVNESQQAGTPGRYHGAMFHPGESPEPSSENNPALSLGLLPLPHMNFEQKAKTKKNNKTNKQCPELASSSVA